MYKKINSEIKIQDPEFKIKIGTTDKKNPNILYIQIGTYIKPNNKKISYNEDITYIDKISKNYFKEKFKNSDIYSKNFIFVTDVADERINVKKKSFLEMEIHLKRINKNNESFIAVSKELYNYCINDFVYTLKETFTHNGFEYFKTKK